jgi:gliding motility-associated-like protein
MLVANPGFACADTIFATIDIFNTLTADYTFSAGCSGTPVVFSDASVTTEAGDIISWGWSFGDGGTSTDQNTSHDYADGGTYNVTLTVETDKGCISTIVKSVTVLPGPDANFSVENICQNEPALFNNLTTFSAGTSSAGYTWLFGDGTVSNDDDPIHNYDASGTYYVTLIAASIGGCTDTITLPLIVGVLPETNAGPDDSVAYLAPYVLNGSGTGTFNWSPAGLVSDAASPNPTTQLETSQWFVLTVTSPDGCIGIDSVFIYVIQRTIIMVPNAFSPNGDNVNDELFILNHDVNKLEEYSIYNRWGQQVFTTTDIAKGWDGTFKGKEQEMGSYIYVVRAIDSDNQEIQLKGNVTLVR